MKYNKDEMIVVKKKIGHCGITMDKVTLTCKCCSKDFEVKYGERDRLYCSRQCQSLSIKRESKLLNSSICLICSKNFKHYGERIVCSRECLAIYFSQTRIGDNNPAFKENKESKQCPECKKQFIVHRNGLHKNCTKIFCNNICQKKYITKLSKTPEDKKYPSIFRKIRIKILKRDNFTCSFCNNAENLHVHHIDYDRNNNKKNNLISLCHKCHMMTNSKRDFWITLFSVLLSNSKLVKKGWGFEVHITNNSEYCLKYLVFFKGKKFSLHYHDLKKELWHCLRGKLQCFLVDKDLEEKHSFIINFGDKVEIDRKTIHQLVALENSIITEVSTPDYKEDSKRLIKGD